MTYSVQKSFGNYWVFDPGVDQHKYTVNYYWVSPEDGPVFEPIALCDSLEEACILAEGGDLLEKTKGRKLMEALLQTAHASKKLFEAYWPLNKK